CRRASPSTRRICWSFWSSRGLYGAAFLSFELAGVRGLEGNDMIDMSCTSRQVTEKPKSECLGALASQLRTPALQPHIGRRCRRFLARPREFPARRGKFRCAGEANSLSPWHREFATSL